MVSEHNTTRDPTATHLCPGQNPESLKSDYSPLSTRNECISVSPYRLKYVQSPMVPHVSPQTVDLTGVTSSSDQFPNRQFGVATLLTQSTTTSLLPSPLKSRNPRSSYTFPFFHLTDATPAIQTSPRVIIRNTRSCSGHTQPQSPV